MTMQVVIQAAESDKRVELFQIDARAIGGPVYYMTNDKGADGNPIMWGGQEYTPTPIEAEGFEWNGQGALPQPKIRVANVTRLLSAAILDYNELLGAVVTRFVTFAKFLDDGDETDPNAWLTKDVYKINRKSAQTNKIVEWELAAALDQEGKVIPGRQILRNACTHIYRTYNSTTGQFDYTRATCPYAGASTFDTNGSPSANSGDKCGKKVSDCKLRFGESAELPFRGFPGVARTRVR